MFTKKKAEGKRNAKNLNTSETASFAPEAWKEKTKNKSKYRESFYHSKNSMNKENMYHVVVLPDREKFYVENYEDPVERDDIHEWWAENTVDFLNEIQLLWGILTESNDEWANLVLQSHKDKEHTTGYPKAVTYKWKANREVKPKVLPIDSYIDHVLFWCNSQVENENIFPTDEECPFPDDFRKHLLKMFQRMFRIFAVIYSNEPLCHRKGAEDTSLEMCFRHFLYFGWKWELLDTRESKSIDKVTAPIRAKFERDQKNYLNRES